VTGARPFRGDSDFSIMSAHLETQPVPPIQVDPTLPAALNEIILMALAKDPAQRFQSASAFQAAVHSARSEFPAGPSTPAPTTKQPPAAPLQVPPPHPTPSRRGLYMALGAVLAVVVLAIGATQVPKWLKTRAAENPVPAADTGQQQPPAALPEQAPVQEPAPEAPAAAKRIDTPRTARPGQPVTSQPVQVAPPAQQQSVAPSQPAPAPAAAVQADAAALKEIRKAWPMLASRAGAASSSLQNLQQQQQRSGLGLRGDITASWKRMEHYMDQVEAALAAEDVEAAKENMENAEREVAVLEKFLGR